MKTTTILMAACLAAGSVFTGCSNDDNPVENHPQDGAQIRFNVVAAATPRIANVETTTNSINSFLVNAFTDNNPFMTNVTVSKENGA